MEHKERSPMSKAFPVTSICREDLMHQAVGYTMNEARMVSDDRMVSDEQMLEIARRLGRNASNQIVKSSIKIVAETVIANSKSHAK